MWRLKLLIQFVLGVVPFGEKLNYLLQRLYSAHTPKRMEERVVHVARELAKLNSQFSLDGKVVVEVGTGWYPISPFLLYLLGVRECRTYDHVRHVRLELVEMLVAAIRARLADVANLVGIPLDILQQRVARWNGCVTLDEYLKAANTTYHAPADATATGLPAQSVDVVYSYAVLAHLPRPVLEALITESKRILKPDGRIYHYIGMHDPFSGFDPKRSKVDFLKYSEQLWGFFVNSRIHYNNRLRERQFLDAFDANGLQLKWRESEADPADVERLRHMTVDRSFAGMTPEELAVFRARLLFALPTAAALPNAATSKV